MVAAINDLSFGKKFSNKEEAVQKVRQWMEVCKKLELQETTAIEKICSEMIDTSAEIAPDYPLITLVKEFKTRDEQRYLYHLFANLEKPENIVCDPFCLKGQCSYICSWARKTVVVSLESDIMFDQPILNGQIGQREVAIKNISKQEHIREYEEFLGIRHYEANKKHRKQPYIDAAGRYVDAMDLDEEEAQKLLDHAVEIEGNIYGKRKGQYYCFQRHHDNCYHGYQNNDLELHIRNKIDEKNWD